MTTLRGEGGYYLEFFLKFHAYSFGHSGSQAKFQNRSFAPCRLFMKFTPKYTTVRGEGGVLEFFLKFQAYSFGHSGGHAKFKNRSLTPSRLFMKFTPQI